MSNYVFHYEGKAFYPEGGTLVRTHEEVASDNAALSSAEVDAFKTRESNRWFVYVRELQNAGYYGLRWRGDLTTFNGAKLADFEWCGPEYKAGFGAYSRRRNLRARGIDGRDWYGTAYVSSGNYARIRTCV